MTQNIAQLFKNVRTTEEAVAECTDEAEPNGIVELEDRNERQKMDLIVILWMPMVSLQYYQYMYHHQ